MALWLTASLTTVQAQNETERLPHSSMWLLAPSSSSTRVLYYYDAEGTEYRMRWGMDTAWNDGNNIRRGANHIGKENLSYGRLSFQPTDSVGDDLKLSSAQMQDLRKRVTNMKATGVTTVLLNCDPYDPDKLAMYYYAKPQNWYNVIKATVVEAQKLGMTIEAIAPMNEPDYIWNGQGTKEHFLEVVKLLRADPFFDDIRISAGNTLNPDGALEWYNFMKPYVQEGNTHQLAGSFDNYARFFQTVRRDGNIATADELHNTMEAFVGVEYGLQNGIWWGYDGVCRGRYCKATSGGRRLGYGENRPKWTAGCVYRLPDGSVDAFLGSSERQANTTDFEISSLDHDVFYDGYGPVRSYAMQIPGGTGYQVGQTNAECVIHITKGNDVPLSPIANGEYVIMNRGTKRIMATSTSSNGSHITQRTRYNHRNDELWSIEAVPATVGGDFSYFYITSKVGDRLIDVDSWNLNEGGSIIVYKGGKGDIEQWHFIYAGDGDYFIQSRYSGLFLGVASSSAVVTQRSLPAADNERFRWRLISPEADPETTPPAPPTGLKATPQISSVLLQWTSNAEADVASYIVLRGEATNAGGQNWQTIGRQIRGTEFVDNSLQMGKAYLYKIKAVDRCGNRSDDSESCPGQTLSEQGLVARYTFDQTLFDDTPNQMDAVCDANPAYSTAASLFKQGEAALNLNTTQTSNHYLSLPHAVGDLQEMTVATWVRWRGGNSWQRIFDFGNDTDHYIFLTPKNGSGKLSLVLKNGGEEQILNSSAALPSTGWHHVAVTLSQTEVKIYIDGNEVATTEAITIRPADFRPALCYIGRSQYSADSYYYGYIDDFCIFNYALTPDQIQEVKEGLPTGIMPIPVNDTSHTGASGTYTLGGTRVSGKLQHGKVYIVNGKKVYVK